MKRKNKQPVDDFSGLVKFIGDKFDRVDGRLGNIDSRLNHINGRLDHLQTMFRNLQAGVDAYAKRADTYFQEMVMLSHKVDRHEKWLRQIADKVGIKLHS